METKFNFKSQICTDKNQSERLLSLGLKKETADIVLTEFNDGSWRPTMTWIEEPNDYDASLYPEFETNDIPAWSLHRLIEMMPNSIAGQGWLSVGHCGLHYSRGYGVADNGLYESIVRMYEWLIKEGYFDKEYLV